MTLIDIRSIAFQVWLWYNLESPSHATLKNVFQLLDWTATYRRDSTISIPYAKVTIGHINLLSQS